MCHCSATTASREILASLAAGQPSQTLSGRCELASPVTVGGPWPLSIGKVVQHHNKRHRGSAPKAAKGGLEILACEGGLRIESAALLSLGVTSITGAIGGSRMTSSARTRTKSPATSAALIALRMASSAAAPLPYHGPRQALGNVVIGRLGHEVATFGDVFPAFAWVRIPFERQVRPRPDLATNPHALDVRQRLDVVDQGSWLRVITRRERCILIVQ
jgi:hypothetical protein